MILCDVNPFSFSFSFFLFFFFFFFLPGFEATGAGTGYVHCKLDFLNIDNIHIIRRSYNNLQVINIIIFFFLVFLVFLVFFFFVTHNYHQ